MGAGSCTTSGPQLALISEGTGGYDSSWVPWWTLRVNKVIVESRVVCGQNTVESTTWAQICFLKMTFLGLGIRQHFTVSYLYPVHPQSDVYVGESRTVYCSGMSMQEIELLKEEVDGQHQEEDASQSGDLA